MRARILPDFTVYVFLMVISLMLFGEILWYMNVNRKPQTREEVLFKVNPPEHLVYKCCTPLNITMKKNLFFIKTHKSGGSTVQNVILRFAKKYSLDVMWPIYITYFIPISTLSLQPESLTPNNKYHILAYHTRFTPRLKSFQYPDTMMITILRHPAKLFQSAYDYYGWDFFSGMSFETFLKAPVKPFLWTVDSAFVYRGYNQLSVDLGFDIQQASNETAIREFVRTIDDEFDFVMIAEYMDASMILLANLMGWPLEYVKHLNKNVRPYNPNEYVQTEQDKLQLMELNKVDTILYNHFLQKLRRCIRQYGEHRMNQQILKLQEMNRQLKEKCVAFEHRVDLILVGMNYINYIPKNFSDGECVDAVNQQGIFEADLRISKLIKKINETFSDRSSS